MVRRNIDNIEIIEPPLGELTKKHSYKRTCFTGCGCLVFLIIAVVIGLRLYIGSGPSTLKSVPSNFPADIPIYDRDAIDRITFISGKYKNRGIEIAAFFPKIILSPLLIKTNPTLPTTSTESNNTLGQSTRSFWEVITAPVGDHRDTVQIEWGKMDAEPSFIVAYYKKELEKNNYAIEVESEGNSVKQFSFSGRNGVSGSLYVQGDETVGPGTDRAILTVNLPLAK